MTNPINKNFDDKTPDSNSANAANNSNGAINAKSGTPLGTFDYDFFTHTDYTFTAPLHSAQNGHPAMYMANTAAAQIPRVEFPSPSKSTSQPSQAPNLEKQIIDHNQAVLIFPMWQILPSSVQYANGSKVTFEYDENCEVSSIKDSEGSQWARAGKIDGEFYRWERSDGKKFALEMRILADGNFQMVHQSGEVNTFTTDGKMYVSRPFSSKFDLRQSVVRVFKNLSTGEDGVLSKPDLNRGVSFHWKNEDDAQLVTMLKVHFEMIQIQRERAILKLGRGISMDDIAHYDLLMRKAIKALPIPEGMQTTEALFDAVDADNDQNISLSELKAKIAQQKLSNNQKASLNYILLHTEKLHAYTGNGYVDRTERMTKNEFLAHYADVYQQEIGKYMNAGAWGIEKAWRKTMEARRTLYADINHPAESIKMEAIKQGQVGDCLFLAALGSLIAVRPLSIMQLIVQHDNNAFTVTFPGALDTPISVAAPTSSELTLYAKGSEYGIWAPLLEKAYGLLVAKRKNLSSVIPAENTATRENHKSLEFLTGNSSRWEYTQDSYTRALGTCKRSLNENDLRSLLARCFRLQHAVIAAALKGAPPERGEPIIVGSHAYSVIGWDPKSDMVTLRNPWGVVPLNATQTDFFRFETGKKITDDGTEGILKLSLSSFYNKFEALCIETPATAVS